MLRIGDFSQLAQVSVPTLRHYDELGLLKPAHVDKFTDYRYYDMAQLPRLNRILALKDLGLSLEQIRKLLVEDVPTAQLRGMLAMKRADIEQQITQEQARLARVEARLRQIEDETRPPKYEIVLKKIEAQIIAGVLQVVPHVSQMNEYRRRVLTALHDGVRAAGLDEVREELMVYHNPEYTDDDINMEAAVTLDARDLKRIEATQMPAQLRVWELPGVATLATTVHHGVLWEIPQAIIAVFAWIGQNGYRSDGPIRELHLFGREVDIPDTQEAYEIPRVIEIQVPVARAEG